MPLLFNPVGPGYLLGAVLLSFLDFFALGALAFFCLAGFAELVAVLPLDEELPPLVCAKPKPAQSTTIHKSVATFFTDSPLLLLIQRDPVNMNPGETAQN